MTSSKDIESLVRRINGIGPISWKEGIDARDQIKRLLDEFSCRRVLFQAHAWEVPEETVASVLDIRREIVATLKNVRQGRPEHRLLRLMAKGCLDYLDNREIPKDRKIMEAELDKLRLLFGACLLVLAERQDLDISGELRAIVHAVLTWRRCVSASLGKRERKVQWRFAVPQGKRPLRLPIDGVA